jgi:hypothetical protein
MKKLIAKLEKFLHSLTEIDERNFKRGLQIRLKPAK